MSPSPHLHYLVLALFSPAVLAHWVLNSPVPVKEFDETTEANAPCGGGDPSNRGTVTTWPIGGYPVSLLTTHPAATWSFRIADAAGPKTWADFAPNISQTGLGHVCFSAVPAAQSLVGREAVLQMVQTAVDGELYQCAAVKFVDGPAAMVPADCTNSTGVSATWHGVAGQMPGSSGPGSGSPAAIPPSTLPGVGDPGPVGPALPAPSGVAIAPPPTPSQGTGAPPLAPPGTGAPGPAPIGAPESPGSTGTPGGTGTPGTPPAPAATGRPGTGTPGTSTGTPGSTGTSGSPASPITSGRPGTSGVPVVSGNAAPAGVEAPFGWIAFMTLLYVVAALVL